MDGAEDSNLVSQDESQQPGRQPGGREPAGKRERSSLIYCGFCGALNPSTNHFCAACGATLVDAFHATEGLRVYERPDSASPLIELIPAGTELEIVEDPNAPEDFVRVRLPYGRLGYIRLQEVEALVGESDPAELARRPDINTHARGCVTPTASVGALALLIVVVTLGLILLYGTDTADVGVLLLAFCVGVVPLMLLTIGLYLYSRGRDERLEEEEEEAASGQQSALGKS